ncbi:MULTISPECIES: response regulator transcription factor [Rhodococcus]|uniref:Response regulator transcription factor n=2 Tax=Rhodococcus TaxID=1827 RepID=A0A7M2XIE9_9NOCA|nr:MULTISPECIES: response regulator transcription factor [Rhodococcus]AWZ25908.1 DNA-binding response regulator [Rhodococcus pyridinivorans]QOV97477.1 response regulator transcription factor [Rhodococcus pyridinivorans]QQM51964.1 response regulator transcription factor [Rhodococcus pyridinivorans]QXU52436.1 response regulator transcription factor [Rhodococcus sp. LW-XY12]WMM71387.1 response regulator transcription factor [Rhodococcus pyridinivorans]
MASVTEPARDTRSDTTIRIGLVDDQQLVRAGFRMVLESQPDIEVVVEASDGEAAVAELERVRADVVLMDVQMPRVDGISATRSLLRSADAPKVVVLTTFDNDDYIVQAIAAGASGFLLKDAPPEDLLAAVRTVHRGDAVMAPRATRSLLHHVSPLLDGAERRAVPVAVPEDLTPRELEVLVAMAHGLTNGEIAERFVLSETTVKTHVGRVLAKTGSRDRVQAVLFAFRAGLVHPDDLLGSEE